MNIERIKSAVRRFCLKKKKMDVARILLGNPRVDLNVQDSAGKFPETIAR